jgi:uracil-DNA glycosylase family 4
VTLSREDCFREMGLWPLWRLKDAVEAAPASEAVSGVLASPPAVQSPPPAQGMPSGAARDMDWDALRAAVKTCTLCGLHKSRTQGVPGVGDLHAEWLFVGEAPGADEDRQGEPFVGQAGKLLDAMLGALRLKRGENVYIANVLKSRPPGNRDPLPEEVAACLPYLERQIDLIGPKIIVALGRFAAQSLLLTDTPIGRMRGRVHEYRGVPLVVTYHPAYLLRNPADKSKVWEDLLLAANTLSNLKARART